MRNNSLIIIVLLLISGSTSFSQSNGALEPYLGTWALTLPHNGSNDAGWLEVTQEDGYIDASLMWYGGSVTPMSNAYVQGENLVVTFTRKRKVGENREHLVTSWLNLHLEKEELNGTRHEPYVDGTGVRRESFTGFKIPATPPTPDLSKLKFGDPIQLLDKNSLKGWKLTREGRANGWSINKGVLLTNPVQNDPDKHIYYGNLRTESEFDDFNIKLEVNVPEGNNSGIYLRGIYEIQVVDSYGKDLDSHNMGALYSRITPSVAAEKPAGKWQTFDITLVDRHVTVILNGTTIIDNQPVLGCTGGALTSNEFIPGPLYLQGDHGKVSYRNIVLTPIVK